MKFQAAPLYLIIMICPVFPLLPSNIRHEVQAWREQLMRMRGVMVVININNNYDVVTFDIK